jgi:NADPH2:quinone reductase
LAIRPVPEGLDNIHAAALTSAYHTAYVSLYFRGQLKAGEVLLVHGAGGGVGLAAVEIGKLLGAKVIATASTKENRQAASDHGADHVLDVEDGFRVAVKELTQGKGADVIYDPVGGDVFDESVRCINFEGRLLVVGFASGRIPEVAANMPLIKSFSVVGVRAGEFSRHHPDLGRKSIEQIDLWAGEGKLTPHVCATFPLEDAAKAFAMLQNREAIGRVVVTI